MKANQSFKQNDDAVSPVIGVILMVAITVVLAAVVFVLVGNLTGDGTESAPTVGFQRSESNDRLTVITAPTPAVPWSDFTVRAQGADNEIHASLNGAPVVADPNIAGGTEAHGEADPMAGGDYFEFCASLDGTTTGAVDDSDVTITVTHTPSGSLLGSFEFASIAACTA